MELCFYILLVAASKNRKLISSEKCKRVFVARRRLLQEGARQASAPLRSGLASIGASNKPATRPFRNSLSAEFSLWQVNLLLLFFVAPSRGPLSLSDYDKEERAVELLGGLLWRGNSPLQQPFSAVSFQFVWAAQLRKLMINRGLTRGRHLPCAGVSAGAWLRLQLRLQLGRGSSRVSWRGAVNMGGTYANKHSLSSLWSIQLEPLQQQLK